MKLNKIVALLTLSATIICAANDAQATAGTKIKEAKQVQKPKTAVKRSQAKAAAQSTPMETYQQLYNRCQGGDQGACGKARQATSWIYN